MIQNKYPGNTEFDYKFLSALKTLKNIFIVSHCNFNVNRKLLDFIYFFELENAFLNFI